MGAFIVAPDGRVLLVRSHKWNDGWAFPGGHVRVGERLADAVRREAREETGLDVRDVELLLFQEFIHGAPFWKRAHFIFFDFLCRSDSTEVTLSHEAEEYAWVTPDEAEGMLADDYTRRVLARYRARA